MMQCRNAVEMKKGLNNWCENWDDRNLSPEQARLAVIKDYRSAFETSLWLFLIFYCFAEYLK